MIDPNDGVSDGDELEVIEPYTSIAAVWLVLEMGKWGVTPRHGVNQTKTADLRGDKPFGDTGDCKASIRALHQMHHAALVRHPIAVLYQRLLSCPHILHIPLSPQLLVTKGKELRKPHNTEQLTTTIVIYIVLSMIHYAPDVRHAAIYFSRLISQSLARTKLGTEELDNEELEGLYDMSDEPGDDKIGDDLFRNSLNETVHVRTIFSRHPTSLTYFFCRCTAPRKPCGLMALRQQIWPNIDPTARRPRAPSKPTSMRAFTCSTHLRIRSHPGGNS